MIVVMMMLFALPMSAQTTVGYAQCTECYAERSQAYQTLVSSSLLLVCSRGYFSTNTMKAANGIYHAACSLQLFMMGLNDY